jgi:hypothetical protein
LRIYSLNDGNSPKTKSSPLLRTRSGKAVGFYRMRALLGWSPKNY